MSAWNGPIADGKAVREGPPEFIEIDSVENPVLTSDDVTGLENPTGVADPFVVHEGGRYHAFFEVITDDPGEDDVFAEVIGHAVSDDMLDWTYTDVVLDTAGHLAYPYVFHWNDEWYMAPDTGIEGQFRIYRASSFPTDWEHVETLVERDGLVDPSPFRWNSRWYALCGVLQGEQDTDDYDLSLYHADELFGEWTEHPASPVATGNSIARPGGRPIVHDTYVDVFFQDCQRTYGDKVQPYKISELTPETYDHERYETGPIVEASFDEAWNYDGMHHVDFGLAYAGDRNVVATDGKATGWNQRFSIGFGQLP